MTYDEILKFLNENLDTEDFCAQMDESLAAEAARGEAFYSAFMRRDPDMDLLGIRVLDVAGLRKARKQALFAAHPDRGGSAEQVIAVQKAYERLIQKLDRG